MSSDSERKAAEEYALASGWSCLDEQLAGAEAFAIRDAYLAGRSSALKELEQVAREAFNAGQARRFIVRTETVNASNASTVQTSSPETFRDYWQDKTESRESVLSELVADGEKNGEYEIKEAEND